MARVCSGCAYFDVGRGCKLSGTRKSMCDNCHIGRDNVTAKQAIRILHDYQKYRRGKGSFLNCPSPYLIGIAIDRAIHELRWL